MNFVVGLLTLLLLITIAIAAAILYVTGAYWVFNKLTKFLKNHGMREWHIEIIGVIYFIWLLFFGIAGVAYTHWYWVTH